MATKSTKTKNAPTQMGITLTEFCGQIDTYLGRATDIENAVRTYRAASDTASQVSSKSAARAAATAALDRFIEIGHGYVDRQPVRAVVRGGAARKAVKSDVVARAYPELWERSRVTTNVMVVKSAVAVVNPIVVPPLRTAPEAWAFLDQLKSMNTLATKDVELSRELMRSVFDEVTEVWNGEPQATNDGWVLGWNPQQRFNEALCREIAESEGIDLAPLEVLTSTAGRVTYELSSGDGADDEADAAAE